MGLTGGNPRALIQIATIYQWSTGAWLHDLGTNVVVPVLARIRAEGLLEELHILLEDPDAAVTRGLAEAPETSKATHRAQPLHIQGSNNTSRQTAAPKPRARHRRVLCMATTSIQDTATRTPTSQEISRKA